MRLIKYSVIILLLGFSFIFSQSKNQISEDRVKVLINEQMEKIEDQLTKKQEEQQKDIIAKMDLNAESITQKYNFLAWLGGLLGIGLIGGLFTTITFLKKYINNKVEKEIDFAVYKLDPRRWPIQIPKENFDKEKERLEKLKYIDLNQYIGLDVNLGKGITIYRVFNEDDLKKLKKVMDDQMIDPIKSCIVVYYTGQQRLDTKILEPYDNYVLSNMPGTLSSQIFAASRNIV